jgi:hypothetical protein
MSGGRDDQDARDLSTGKVKISKELWPVKSACGNEGHLPTHPGKVPITVAGGQLAFSKATLSKGVCGDDPPTMQDVQQSKRGEDHLEKVYGGVSWRPRHPMGACCGGVSLRPRDQMGACVRICSSRTLRILGREERIMGRPGEAETGLSVSAPD